MNNVCKILRNSYVICSRNFLRTFRKSLLFHKNIQPSPGSEVINTDDEQTYEILSKDMQVYKDFITIEEEEGLLKEVENHLKRLRYEYDHWDDAIHGYRETERKSWKKENRPIIDRVRKYAFDENAKLLPLVHVLDLSKEGWIKPHVDSVKFCGDTIAGISLLSSAVMRLINENDKTKFGDVHLERRSLYVIKKKARYDYSHAVLKNEESYFKGQKIEKDRRISVICRSEPG